MTGGGGDGLQWSSHVGGLQASGWEHTPSDAVTSVVLPHRAVASPVRFVWRLLFHCPNHSQSGKENTNAAQYKPNGAMQQRIALQCVRTLTVHEQDEFAQFGSGGDAVPTVVNLVHVLLCTHCKRGILMIYEYVKNNKI